MWRDPGEVVVTWHGHAVHGHVGLSQETAEDALHLRGGDVLSSPAEGVPATVTEVHVAQVVHHQHVTWGPHTAGGGRGGGGTLS